MILNLDNLNTSTNNIMVKEIALSGEALDTWLTLNSEIFHTSLAESSEIINLFIQQIIPGKIKLYVAYYSGKPAAISMMIEHTNLVSLHFIGTLAPYRNKGLGYAVTQKPLLYAKQMGYAQAGLLASDMGKHLYEKLGFTYYGSYDVYQYFSIEKNIL